MKAVNLIHQPSFLLQISFVLFCVCFVHFVISIFEASHG